MASKLLRDLAQNAKNRLINRQGGALKSRALYNPNVSFKIISNDDPEFDAKARNLRDEDLIFPIKKLINQDYYKTLSSVSKERYLLEIIDKYAKFRSRLNSEQERKVL